MNIHLTHGGELHLHLDLENHATVDALKQLLHQGARTMSTIQEVKDELAAINTGVDAMKAAAAAAKADAEAAADVLKAQIADLKAQVEAGSPVTQADLDAFDAQADEILAKLAVVPVELPPVVDPLEPPPVDPGVEDPNS